MPVILTATKKNSVPGSWALSELDVLSIFQLVLFDWKEKRNEAERTAR